MEKAGACLKQRHTRDFCLDEDAGSNCSIEENRTETIVGNTLFINNTLLQERASAGEFEVPGTWRDSISRLRLIRRGIRILNTGQTDGEGLCLEKA